MTSKEAPERVWRVAPYIHQHYKHGLSSWPVKEHAGDGATEYVRADLLTAAQAENARLREALLFYADPSEHRDYICVNGHDRCGVPGPDCPYCETIPIPDFYSKLDFGATARAALQEGNQ